MKRALLVAAMLLTVGAGPALAQTPGFNLAWDDCQASLALGLNKTSTCLSNTETVKTLYGTYVLSVDADALAGNDIVLDIYTNSATLPCWWNFTVAPRSTAYQMQFNAVCPDNGGVGIFDYWSSVPGGPTGGSNAILMPTSAVPRIRINAVVAVNAGQAQPVPASTGEIYSFTLRLLHDATAGCSGCLTSACFELSLIRVTQAGFPSIDLTATSTRAHVFWQGGAVQAPDCGFGCYCPTGNKSWGAIKACYR